MLGEESLHRAVALLDSKRLFTLLLDENRGDLSAQRQGHRLEVDVLVLANDARVFVLAKTHDALGRRLFITKRRNVLLDVDELREAILL